MIDDKYKAAARGILDTVILGKTIEYLLEVLSESGNNPEGLEESVRQALENLLKGLRLVANGRDATSLQLPVMKQSYSIMRQIKDDAVRMIDEEATRISSEPQTEDTAKKLEQIQLAKEQMEENVVNASLYADTISEYTNSRKNNGRVNS